jgi:formyltetrahydrofolate deformylase
MFGFMLLARRSSLEPGRHVTRPYQRTRDGTKLSSTTNCNIRLLIDCPDHKGLIAAVSSFIALHNGNILSADQYVSDPPNGTFFMRLEIESQGFGLGRDEFDAAFGPLARQHGMNWRVRFIDRPKRMAILVSKYGHCLIDLLWRWETGELDAEIPLVISNHADLRAKVEAHGIPFHYLPVAKESKDEQEAQIEALLREHAIELVVLARYMQIISPRFLESYRQPIINIHHSFLPAFVGANPYRQAHARGVKIIGATAHYVTAELDAGPILHQGVAHISHRDGLDDLIRIGREVERRVLAQAVRWHLEDRVLVQGIRTVVFE